MKKVYLAIHILIDGNKNTKTVTLEVPGETYDLLSELAEDNVVDNIDIYDNYDELQTFVESL